MPNLFINSKHKTLAGLPNIFSMDRSIFKNTIG